MFYDIFLGIQKTVHEVDASNTDQDIIQCICQNIKRLTYEEIIYTESVYSKLNPTLMYCIP